MKSLIRFWKNDLLNKLIVLSVLALIAAAGVLAWLVFSMPAGKSLQGAAAELIPWISTPTRLPPFESSATAEGGVPGLGPTLTAIPSPALTFAIPTAEPPTKLPVTATATPTVTPTPVDPMACIPDGPVQKGKVLEIIDGNTVRVMIDRLVYVMRYIGVEVGSSATSRLEDKALQMNADLVYGKEVTLFADVSDKDPRGRLLRYVLVGDVFVNFELIRGGNGLAASQPPDTGCEETFKLAQQSAMDEKLGIWAPTPTATPKK